MADINKIFNYLKRQGVNLTTGSAPLSTGNPSFKNSLLLYADENGEFLTPLMVNGIVSVPNRSNSLNDANITSGVDNTFKQSLKAIERAYKRCILKAIRDFCTANPTNEQICDEWVQPFDGLPGEEWDLELWYERMPTIIKAAILCCTLHAIADAHCANTDALFRIINRQRRDLRRLERRCEGGDPGACSEAEVLREAIGLFITMHAKMVDTCRALRNEANTCTEGITPELFEPGFPSPYAEITKETLKLSDSLDKLLTSSDDSKSKLTISTDSIKSYLTKEELKLVIDNEEDLIEEIKSSIDTSRLGSQKKLIGVGNAVTSGAQSSTKLRSQSEIDKRSRGLFKNVETFNGETGDIFGVNSLNGETGNIKIKDLPLVSSLNGSTGVVEGVSAFNGSTGNVEGVSSFNGSTGDVKLVDLIGVNTFNGVSGDIQGINTFNSATGAVEGVSTFNGSTGSITFGLSSLGIAASAEEINILDVSASSIQSILIDAASDSVIMNDGGTGGSLKHVSVSSWEQHLRNVLVSTFNSATGAVEGINTFNSATGAAEGVSTFNSATGAAEGVSTFNSATGAIDTSTLRLVTNGISANNGISCGGNIELPEDGTISVAGDSEVIKLNFGGGILDISANQLDIPKKLRHRGDSDTYLEFKTDHIGLQAGGTTFAYGYSGDFVANKGMTVFGDMSISGDIIVQSGKTVKGGGYTLGAGGATFSSPITIENTGDVALFLNADSDNSGENDNPIISMGQDGGVGRFEIGLVGDAGQNYTDSTANAAFLNTGASYVDLQLATHDTARVTILRTGEVGIGTKTPSHGLDLEGGFNVTGGATFTGPVNVTDHDVIRPNLKDFSETVNAIGTVTGNTAVNFESGNVQTITMNGNCEFTFTNPPASGKAGTVTLIITNGGANTTTFHSSVKWPSDVAPSLTSSGIDIITFLTTDAGSNIFGFVGGLNFS